MYICRSVTNIKTTGETSLLFQCLEPQSVLHFTSAKLTRTDIRFRGWKKKLFLLKEYYNYCITQTFSATLMRAAQKQIFKNIL